MSDWKDTEFGLVTNLPDHKRPVSAVRCEKCILDAGNNLRGHRLPKEEVDYLYYAIHDLICILDRAEEQR